MGHGTAYIALAVTGGSQGIPPRETAFGRVPATRRSSVPGSEAAAEDPHPEIQAGDGDDGPAPRTATTERSPSGS